VPAILAGTTPPVFEDSDYVTVGGADEATHYFTEFGPAWHRTPGAVEWLAKITSARAPTEPTGWPSHRPGRNTIRRPPADLVVQLVIR
jgi:hypothetical protein